MARSLNTQRSFSCKLIIATDDGNQLNVELSGWGFLIGLHQQLLQTVVRKVFQCIVALTMELYNGELCVDNSTCMRCVY